MSDKDRKWETVHYGGSSDPPTVSRLAVPGGHLYHVMTSQSQVVFVPDPPVAVRAPAPERDHATVRPGDVFRIAYGDAEAIIVPKIGPMIVESVSTIAMGVVEILLQNVNADGSPKTFVVRRVSSPGSP